VKILCDPDIDECAVNDGNCNELANCTNVPGSYSCTCINGYTGDGFTCLGKLPFFINVILNCSLQTHLVYLVQLLSVIIV